VSLRVHVNFLYFFVSQLRFFMELSSVFHYTDVNLLHARHIAAHHISPTLNMVRIKMSLYSFLLKISSLNSKIYYINILYMRMFMTNRNEFRFSSLESYYIAFCERIFIHLMNENTLSDAWKSGYFHFVRCAWLTG
jgi:hypothetical protein